MDNRKNFAYSTVLTAPSPADSGTSLVVQAGEGARFPSPPFNVVVWPIGTQPLANNAEIVRVTAISTDTLTIVRAQESSVARTILVSDQVSANLTKKFLDDIETAIAAKANTSHTHVEADVTGLVSDLAGKASTVHTHAEADVTGLVSDLAGKSAVGHTHTKSEVGLGNVDNTSDANKPISTATQTALDAKQASLGYTAENTANKDIDGTLAANSDTKYPSQKATKTYVDAGLATKASTSHSHSEADVTGLTADLAAKEVLTNKSTDTNLGTSDTLYPSQKAVKTYVDNNGGGGGTVADADATTKGKLQLTNDLGGTAALPTVVATHLSSALPLAQGGTAATSASAARTSLGVVIGTDVEAHDADLTAIAALSPSNDDVIQRKAGAWTNRTPAQVKTDLVLTKSDVGLSNVDNTADASKPVSTAQATADALVATNAATALSNHEADTTNIHGITDTSVLETTTGAQAKADAKVIDSIADSDTTHAPSRNAVFDALALKQVVLTPTAVKTTNYTAAAGDLVLTDTTSGTINITLPTTPADKTIIGTKNITFVNSVTVTCGGSSTFSKAGGGTTFTMPTSAQGAAFQYQAGTDLWFLINDVYSLTQLDSRFLLVSNLDTDSTMAANSDTKLASQKAVKTALATKPTATLDIDGALTANSDTVVASQKATKTYADLKLAKASNLSDVANAATAFTNIKQDATSSVKGVNTLTNDLGGTAALPTVPKLINAMAGPLEVHGHSYTAGSTVANTGTDYSESMGMIGRLSSMLKISDFDLRHFGTSGSYLTRTNSAFVQDGSGWASLLQFSHPNNSTHTTPTVVAPNVSNSNGVGLIVHGVNDYQFNATSWDLVGLPAWRHALRTYLSRLRAGALWCSKAPNGTITWDSVFSTAGTWANTAGNWGNTGAAYRQTTDFATPASLTMTLPADWPGGKLAVCLIGQQQGYTTVATMTSGAATMTVAAHTSFPQTGTFVANIAADGSGGTREEVLITSGAGSTTWNITRAQNGTSASAHTAAVVTIANDTYKVNWSTSAASGAGLFTSVPAVGSTVLGGQGVELATGASGLGGPIPITVRFDTIQADAGKTLVLTASNPVAGDTSATVKFDSAWLESPRPRPVIVVNMPRFAPFGTNMATQIPTMNSATNTVIAEFDSMVKVADVDTYFYNRSGVANGATGTGGTIAFTANDKTTFDTLMNAGRGFRMSMQTEDLFVKSIAYVSGNNYTLTVTRAYSTGSNSSKSSGVAISYAAPFHTDQVHPNAIGHALYAQTIYDALSTITVPDNYTLAETAGNWTQLQKHFILPAKSGNWYAPAVNTYAATAQTVQVVSYSPVFIPTECTVTDIMCSVSTLNASSTIAMGIYDSDYTGQQPGGLIADCGTISGGTANARTISSLNVRLRGGLVWLAFLQTGTAATVRTIANNGLSWPLIPVENPISATSVISTANGYIQTGQATLPTSAGSLVQVSGTIAAGNCIAVVAIKTIRPMIA